MFPISTQLPIFFDLTGKPLSNGFLYFGLPNQNPETDPVTVYWDEAGTIPAAQPIRTLNGYAIRDGAAANVYADGAFSFRAKNASGVLVIEAPESEGQWFDLASSGGAALVGANDQQGGALFTQLQQAIDRIRWENEYAPDGLNVLRYVPPAEWPGLMSGTLAYDVAPAIQAAIDACAERLAGVDQVPVSKCVYLPFRKALVGTVLDLTNDAGTTNRRGIRVRGMASGSGDYVYGTTLVGQTNGKAVFEIVDNDNFQLENITITNAATNASTIGVYQARRTGGVSPSSWTGNCLFRNVTVTFTNDGITQNNNFGTIGFLNISGEETTYDRCEVWANSPLILSWSSTIKKAVDSLAASTYDTFEYAPVHVNQGDITEGFSNTVFRTTNCRFIAKGWNAPVVLLHEVGSYHSVGDFTQKRNSTTGPNGTNGVGYEMWNANQITLLTTTESIKTPLLFHRSIGAMQANIRGAAGSVGQAVGLIHYGMDAAGFNMTSSDVVLDYTTTPDNGLITYTAPSGRGVEETAGITLRNTKVRVNKTAAQSAIDSKILYQSINCAFDFLDGSLTSGRRYLRVPIESKSIGVPATATDFINFALPATIGSTSGFSATVKACLHVSNAETETAGSPSSCAVDVTWQITRDQGASNLVVTSQTATNLTANINAAANALTGLTPTHSPTGTASTVLRLASVQSGANNAPAFISGYVEVIYAGGYSRAPLVTLL